MKLRFLEDIKKSGSSCKEYDGLKYYVDTGNVKNDVIIGKEGYLYKDKPSRANITVEVGDILFAKMQNSVKVICIDETNKDYVYSTGFYCLRDDRVLPEYLKYYFLSKEFNIKKDNLCQGATMKALNDNGLKQIDIEVPSISEQKRIVGIVDSLYSIIKLKNEQLEKLDELVKARFVELFGDVANSPKYSGVPLGTICSTLSGGTPTTKVPEYYQGDIPWISTPYLGNNHINGSSAKAYITEDAIKNSATHLIPANTIMFGIRVGVGKSSIIDEPMCANQDIVALMGIDTNKYNLLFVKHTLDSYQSHFDSIKKGATILGITTDDLKKVLIPNVDIGLQNQFATFVEQTDKSKLEVQKSLEKLELLKKALMQKYFG